jgi:hypothetical protein|uniref:Uncharacterized protein n=1 Tax=viral metagenome TaxID=1070528 RepID=A0A6C0LAK8_9ZZZZ
MIESKANKGSTATSFAPAPAPSSASSVNIALKAKYAAYTALVFFLVANPETYKLFQRAFGRWITIADGGCPTPEGFFLHTALFFFLLWALMMFPRDI